MMKTYLEASEQNAQDKADIDTVLPTLGRRNQQVPDREIVLL